MGNVRVPSGVACRLGGGASSGEVQRTKRESEGAGGQNEAEEVIRVCS